MQVQLAAHEGVHRARARQPAQRQHQLIDARVLAEIHLVDEVMLELVDERGKHCRDGHANPPGQLAANIGHTAGHHAQQ